MDRAHRLPRVLFAVFLAALAVLAALPAAAQSAGGHVRGTVYASNTSPLAGALVQAFPSMVTNDTIFPVIETHTDEHGRYDLAVPHRGCYGLSASAAGFMPQYYGGNDPSAPCVEVPPSGIVEGIDFHLRRAGSIGGRVTDAATGDPVVSALVVAFPAGFDSMPPRGDPGGDGTDPFPGPGSAITDEHGEYVIEGVPPGEFIVVAHGEGYVPEFFDEAGRIEDATPVPVLEQQEIRHIDFTLGHGGCISGLVTSDTGEPVEGAQVWVFPSFWTDVAGRGPHPERSTRQMNGITGPDGRYSLCGLSAGDYFVQVWAEGFLVEFYDDAERFEDADPVAVPSDGEVTGIDFALSRGGRIEGVITEGGTDVPVPGAWVMAWPAWSDTTDPGGRPDIGVNSGYAIADSSGHYELGGLVSGRYVVVAESPGFLATYYGDTPDASLATPVDVTAPDATTGIDIGLLRGGSISGVVSDETTGAPIAGAWVELFLPYAGGFDDSTGTRPFPGPGAITEEDGTYRIEGIPSGSHILFCSAWDQGYAPEFYKDARSPERATPVTVTAPGATTGIDFTLSRHGPPGGEISGRVSRENGDAVPGAVVVAVSLAGQAGFATTARDGSYAIRDIRGGSYYVFAAATGLIGEFYDDALGWEEATPVDVPHAAQGIDFVLSAQMNGPGTIEGRVVDASGRGVAQVMVYADATGGSARAFATSRADGAFTLAGLLPGSYHVRATRVGFESAYYGGTSKDDAVVVDVPAGAVRGIDIVLAPPQGESPSAPVTVIGNAPNPFRRMTSIEFRVGGAGPVLVDIFDVRGRHVRRLEHDAVAAGSQQVVWDGRDGGGRTAPAGVYVYRVSAGGRNASGRMLLVE